MNIHTMTSPVLVKDWLTSEFGVTLPHDPTTVKDLNMTADGDLLILLEGARFSSGATSTRPRCRPSWCCRARRQTMW